MIDPDRADRIRVNLIDRPGWGALPAKSSEPLPQPIPHVLLYYTTDTPPCHTHQECVRTCQQLQKEHMEQGLPDIAYNFLVGADGTVYEGRGWYKNPSKLKEKYNHMEGQSLDIAFIGRFYEENKKTVYPDMARAAINLMNIAVLNDYMKGTFNFVEDKEESPMLRCTDF